MHQCDQGYAVEVTEVQEVAWLAGWLVGGGKKGRNEAEFYRVAFYYTIFFVSCVSK